MFSRLDSKDLEKQTFKFKLCNRLPREVVRCPGQLALTDLPRARGLDKMISRGPFQLNRCCDSLHAQQYTLSLSIPTERCTCWKVNTFSIEPKLVSVPMICWKFFKNIGRYFWNIFWKYWLFSLN